MTILSKEEEKKIKEEIKKLEAMRKDKPKLFKKLQINKAISDRVRLLKTERKILGLRQKSEVTKLQQGMADQKAKLMEARRKSAITMEDLYGTKDLFKI